MLEAHKLPAREPSVVLIVAPCAREHARDFVWTVDLDLDIASSLVVDPDPDSDVFQGFEIRVVQHLLCDFETARNAFGRDSRS